jgi:hypothetical protein
VAEYRPDSRSIIYRVDATTMKAEEAFRVDDHIGGLVRDTATGLLHGVSWGSRRFYQWTVGAGVGGASKGTPPAVTRRSNASHYVDYQDCKYAGRSRMICTGIASFAAGAGAPFRLGGLDLVDLRDGRPLHQTPLPLWTPSGLNVAQNPSWFEISPSGRLRASFLPEDDRSTLYTYEAEGKR